MDAIRRINPFENVTGAQKIDSTAEGASAQGGEEYTPPVLEIDVTPDIDGDIDTSAMSLDFEDKLKKLDN